MSDSVCISIRHFTLDFLMLDKSTSLTEKCTSAWFWSSCSTTAFKDCCRSISSKAGNPWWNQWESMVIEPWMVVNFVTSRWGPSRENHGLLSMMPSKYGAIQIRIQIAVDTGEDSENSHESFESASFESEFSAPKVSSGLQWSGHWILIDETWKHLQRGISCAEIRSLNITKRRCDFRMNHPGVIWRSTRSFDWWCSGIGDSDRPIQHFIDSRIIVRTIIYVYFIYIYTHIHRRISSLC